MLNFVFMTIRIVTKHENKVRILMGLVFTRHRLSLKALKGLIKSDKDLLLRKNVAFRQVFSAGTWQ